MRGLFFATFLLAATIAGAQNEIDWDGNYKLQLSDFQSGSSEIGDATQYALVASCRMDFSFQMSSYEFMFTKNFNPRVSCTFFRDAAVLVAPDTATALSMLNFARYAFDLAELYARKFRKKIYEEKGAFSDVNFFYPHYNAIQKEHMERYTQASKDTDIGLNSAKLSTLHDQVLREISELPEFCKTCKPPKKRKK